MNVRRRLLSSLATAGLALGALAAFPTPPAAAAGSIVINEIDSDPSDFIELKNNSASQVDLSGYVLKDGTDNNPYTIPPGAIIQPGGYLVFDALTFALGASDSARLFTPEAALVDTYTWTAHAANSYARCPDGSGDFADSAAVTKGFANSCPASEPPTITAAVTSSKPPTAGWYTTPVTVTFTCTPGTAPLAGSCPAPVTLSGSGADQSVTRSVSDTGGQSDEVTVSDIDIDRAAPAVRIKGAKDGKTYAKKRKPKCVGGDALSGIASCVVKQQKKNKGAKYVVTATAADRAGNVATAKLTYKVSKK